MKRMRRMMLVVPFVREAVQELLTMTRLLCLMFPHAGHVQIAASSFLATTPTTYLMQPLSLRFPLIFFEEQLLSPLSLSVPPVFFLHLLLYVGASLMMIFVVS